jgi:type IV pilus assembly protein PilE
MTHRKPHGFSLIELLAAIAIVGIISAIAYPSYLEQIRQSRRAECSAGLTSLANAMERHYTVNGSYLGAAEGGANTGEPAVYADQCPVDGGQPTYDLAIQAATASTYSLRATPIGNQVEDKCGSFTLTNTGQKGIADATEGVGWGDCW